MDCEVCKTDLWLSAAITPLAPGRAVCPEHAASLPAPSVQRFLLFRYTPGGRLDLLSDLQPGRPSARLLSQTIS